MFGTCQALFYKVCLRGRFRGVCSARVGTLANILVPKGQGTIPYCTKFGPILAKFGSSCYGVLRTTILYEGMVR